MGIISVYRVPSWLWLPNTKCDSSLVLRYGGTIGWKRFQYFNLETLIESFVQILACEGIRSGEEVMESYEAL